MNTVTENAHAIDESQDALYEHQSRAGSSPMRRPTKDALVKHIAQNKYHLGEATEYLGGELDRLLHRIAEAVQHNNEEHIRELAPTVQVIKLVLHRLGEAVPPAEWSEHLPVVIVEKATEDVSHPWSTAHAR